MIGSGQRIELPETAEVGSRYGSVKRMIRSDRWDAIAPRSTDNLLVYLALGRFRRRPPISALPLGLQRDIRPFFGSYSNACRLADDLLFRAGSADAVDGACRRSVVGKLLPNAPYVHRTASRRSTAPTRLRGPPPRLPRHSRRAKLIKLHRQSGKVSYLVYPDFETDPHPALARSVKLSLRTREIDCFDYAATPIHRSYIARNRSWRPIIPPRQVRPFDRTTRETRLLDDTATIGTKDGWQARLTERGFVFRGHRLVRR